MRAPAADPEEIESSGPVMTEAAGARLAESLEPGDLVLVEGEVGAGKSTLIRGAMRALGVEGPIPSPTFTIGRAYRGRTRIAHLDLYRLSGLDGEEGDLLAEYVGPGTITLIEWPGAGGAELGPAAARVRIAHSGGDRRRIEIAAPTDR